MLKKDIGWSDTGEGNSKHREKEKVKSSPLPIWVLKWTGGARPGFHDNAHSGCGFPSASGYS